MNRHPDAFETGWKALCPVGAPETVEEKLIATGVIAAGDASLELSTDSSGSQVSLTKFFSFGSTRSSTGTLGTDMKYTGQRLDGTDLYFYNARYYDAGIGRFISPDQFVQNGPGFDLVSSALTVNLARTGYGAYPQTNNTAPVDTQALNRYSYVLSNPLKYTDPYGWRTWGIGFNFNIGLGSGISVSLMYVWSDRGEKGVSWAGGGGGYAGVGVSGTVQYQTTNADSIEQLRGPQVQVGGSGGEFVNVGAEYVVGNGYQGTNIQVGIGAGLAPVEMHGFLETSGVKVLSHGDPQAESLLPASPTPDGGGQTSYWDPFDTSTW